MISPNLQLVRLDMTRQRCFVCLYKAMHENRPILPPSRIVNVLKVSERGRPSELVDNMDGVQYAFFANLLIHQPSAVNYFEQVPLAKY